MPVKRAAPGIMIPFIFLDNFVDGLSREYLDYSTGLILIGTWTALIFACLVRFPAAWFLIAAGPFFLQHRIEIKDDAQKGDENRPQHGRQMIEPGADDGTCACGLCQQVAGKEGGQGKGYCDYGQACR